MAEKHIDLVSKEYLQTLEDDVADIKQTLDDLGLSVVNGMLNVTYNDGN